MNFKTCKTLIKGIGVVLCLSTLSLTAGAQAVHDVQQIIEAPDMSQNNQTLTRTKDGGYFVVAPLGSTASGSQFIRKP